MRERTNEQQTMSLMRLGYPSRFYSIGDILRMLPKEIDGHPIRISYSIEDDKWYVAYYDIIGYLTIGWDFLDALVNMLILLTHKGHILYSYQGD